MWVINFVKASFEQQPIFNIIFGRRVREMQQVTTSRNTRHGLQANLRRLAIAICTLAITVNAFAGDPVTLVDREPDFSIDGWANQEATDFTFLSSYIVVDVSFDSDVRIDSITTYYDAIVDWTTLNNPTAVLNIFMAPLSSADDPTMGMSVPITIDGNGFFHTITASDLDLVLPAGDYWIGLTPIVDASVGQNFNLRSTSVGFAGNSFWRNPSNFFSNGTDWVSSATDGFGDVFEQRGSMTIEGAIAEAIVTVTGGDLLVDGSCEDDTVVISPTAVAGEVLVNVNGNIQTVSGVTSIEVRGNEGNDSITVNGRLPSSLFGNEGDDTIIGSAGPDYIEGGIGSDNLNAREGEDTIYASAPGVADTAGNTIQGGRSNDEIFGSSFKDTIFGGEANDTIFAFAGDDDIFGGQGADTIFAGDGNDVIRAGESNDEVYGQNGNDTIIGGLGFDLLFGGNGNDIMTGGDGQDTLNGGAGSDTLSGNNNNDVLNGGAGNDTLTGGLQNDTLNGGPGIDTATDTGENGETGIEN